MKKYVLVDIPEKTQDDIMIDIGDSTIFILMCLMVVLAFLAGGIIR